ncbi:chloride channel protein [Rhizobium subbaraonis]|uniref:chloride channel protein n=1 Tax=Rhizobium subbaraonis TaxID=908946 RepID=UPI000BE38BD7|nr:chloride channel protein [Rhizobium subbaraonis]
MRPLYTKSKILRRSRALRGSRDQWKLRLVFWIGAVSTGLISVLFAKMADAAQHLFHGMRGVEGWGYLMPLLVTPAGFMACCYVALKFFPGAQGSGIPQAIAARHLEDMEDRTRLLSLRIAIGKILLTVAGLMSGASIGREGPTVQVGAAIMMQAARWGGIAHARGLILAGSAAGIAAAFNTPMAGIVFAIEEMSRSYQSRANGLVLTTVILSGLAAMGLVGSYTYFGETDEVARTAADWSMVATCGIVGGALGAAFSALALHLTLRIRRWTQPARLRRSLLLAGCCGLFVAVVGILSGGETFGTGYEQARAALEGAPASPLYFAEKLAVTFASMMSGIPGGIFAPSLSVGAGFGSTLALMLGANVGLGALLGMAGYFAGVVQAPMTAFVIILEMTGNHDNVIALMTASMLGYLTSRLISREPLYHGLSRNFIAEAIRTRRAQQRA